MLLCHESVFLCGCTVTNHIGKRSAALYMVLCKPSWRYFVVVWNIIIMFRFMGIQSQTPTTPSIHFIISISRVSFQSFCCLAVRIMAAKQINRELTFDLEMGDRFFALGITVTGVGCTSVIIRKWRRSGWYRWWIFITSCPNGVR